MSTEEVKPKISFEKDGPIKVSNLNNLINSRGESVKTKKTMILCRCGASRAKPFCDGRHNTIGFTDEKSNEALPDRLDEVKGRDISLFCLLYTSPSPRDATLSRMPSSA